MLRKAHYGNRGLRGGGTIPSHIQTKPGEEFRPHLRRHLSFEVEVNVDSTDHLALVKDLDRLLLYLSFRYRKQEADRFSN